MLTSGTSHINVIGRRAFIDRIQAYLATDHGDVYGYAIYAGEYRIFGITNGVLNVLGEPGSEPEVMTLANRTGSTISFRVDPLTHRPVNQVWQADLKGRWSQMPIALADDDAYYRADLSDNGWLLLGRQGGAAYDPATAFKVVNPRTGQESVAAMPTDAGFNLRNIAARGNYFGVTLEYSSFPPREVAALYGRSADGNWIRQDYRVPGALSTSTFGVNSRGDMVGYYRTTDEPAGNGGPYVVRDGAITKLARLSATLQGARRCWAKAGRWR